MLAPAIIGFYGSSNSGKTTLIVKTVKYLVKNGYRIATIKKTDKNIPLDIEGKDTWLHGKAGASITVLSSNNSTDIMIYDKMEINDIIKSIISCGSVDVILVEGATDLNIPKINLGSDEKRDNTILEYYNNFTDVIKVIEKEIEKKKDIDISIIINGDEIVLSEFPREIIKNTLVGMLSILKGVDQINDIEIYFKI
jgi:molybdopterin-guanine dinucleotide biosynthesis protein B